MAESIQFDSAVTFTDIHEHTAQDSPVKSSADVKHCWRLKCINRFHSSIVLSIFYRSMSFQVSRMIVYTLTWLFL